MNTTLRKSLVYGISTGITLAVTVLFVLFLRRYTDSIGLTLLVLALIVCFLSLLYFGSRWYLTEVIGSNLASEAERLSEAADSIASGNEKIDSKEFRKIIGGLLSTARAAGPTVLFILMAGSLMGGVLVVVGLVNAAVIFQQTEVLERQTQRIDDQNTLIAVQFLNESAQGLRAISSELQALEQARSDLENSIVFERVLKRILQQAHGGEFDGGVVDLFCGVNQNVCGASIDDFVQSFEDEGSYSEFFPILVRMGRFAQLVSLEQSVSIPYAFDIDQIEFTSDGQNIRATGGNPTYVVSEQNTVLEAAIVTCTGRADTEFIQLRNSMLSYLWALPSQNTFRIDGTVGDIDQFATAELWQSLYRLEDVVVDANPYEINLRDVAQSIEDYFLRIQDVVERLQERCIDEIETLQQTRDFIVDERDSILTRQSAVVGAEIVLSD